MSENETVDTLRSRYETQGRRIRAMDLDELADLVDRHCADVRDGYPCDDCGPDCWHEEAVARRRAMETLAAAARPGGLPFVTPRAVRDAGAEVPAGVRVGSSCYSNRAASELQPGGSGGGPAVPRAGAAREPVPRQRSAGHRTGGDVLMRLVTTVHELSVNPPGVRTRRSVLGVPLSSTFTAVTSGYGPGSYARRLAVIA